MTARRKQEMRPGLYVLTEHERHDFPELITKTTAILKTGIAALQYRNKAAGETQKVREASILQALCHEYRTLFLINDDVDLALKLDADGVHIGSEDLRYRQARDYLGETFLIGVSCYNSLARAESAVTEGADYIAFGAMFPSPTKTETVKAGPDLIRAFKSRHRIPVAAIGGITPGNCTPLIRAGTDLLAVISSVYRTNDPAGVVSRFNQLLQTKSPS